MAVRQHSSSFLRFIPSILNSIQNNTLAHSHTDPFRVICVNRLSRNYRVLRHWKPFRLKVDVFLYLQISSLKIIAITRFSYAIDIWLRWLLLLLFFFQLNRFPMDTLLLKLQETKRKPVSNLCSINCVFSSSQTNWEAKTMLLQRYLQFFLREICVVLLFAVPKLINCLISIWVLSLIIERKKKHILNGNDE